MSDGLILGIAANTNVENLTEESLSVQLNAVQLE